MNFFVFIFHSVLVMVFTSSYSLFHNPCHDILPIWLLVVFNVLIFLISCHYTTQTFYDTPTFYLLFILIPPAVSVSSEYTWCIGIMYYCSLSSKFFQVLRSSDLLHNGILIIYLLCFTTCLNNSVFVLIVYCAFTYCVISEPSMITLYLGRSQVACFYLSEVIGPNNLWTFYRTLVPIVLKNQYL